MRKSQQEKEEKMPKPPRVKAERKPRAKKESVPRAPGNFKNTIGDFFRNRIVIGFICVGVSLLIAFVGVPVVQGYVSQRVPVVVAAAFIERGTLITPDMLKLKDIAAIDRPANAATSIEQASGAYAAYPFIEGDMIVSPKLMKARPVTHPYLYELPEGKKAISISVKGLAEGLTGKLRAGDIVSVYAIFNKSNVEEDYAAVQPKELRYMRVLAVSNSLGHDIDVESEVSGVDVKSDERERLPATITLMAGDLQAAALAGIDHNATVHVALVARSDNADTCKRMLDEQDAYILEVERMALENEEGADVTATETEQNAESSSTPQPESSASQAESEAESNG